jgi:hypothetical protein
MLLQPELIEALAETLEGLLLPNADASSHDATILVFHPRDKKDAKQAVAGKHNASSTPLLEINLSEQNDQCNAVIHSALGMLELRDIEEVRLSPSTEEAALFLHTSEPLVTVVTISSHGVLQVYANVPRSVSARDLSDLAEEDLRAAVALKIFSEGARVFTSAARVNR